MIPLRINSGQTRTNDVPRQFHAQPAKKGQPTAAADQSAYTLSTRQDSAPRASHKYIGNPFSDSPLPDPNNFKSESNRESTSTSPKRISIVKSGPPLHVGSDAPDSTLASSLPGPTPKTTSHNCHLPSKARPFLPQPLTMVSR